MAEIPGLAVLHYDTPSWAVVKPGDFVLCAISGERIALDDLMYWSAEFQEAYRGAPEATQGFLRRRGDSSGD